MPISPFGEERAKVGAQAHLGEEKMDFTSKKLSKEAAADLMICPVGQVRPFELLFSPTYIFLRLNEKFVSVKAPLDFFTPEELAQIQAYESVFFPKFLDSALEFQKAGARIRVILENRAEPLAPAEYELSDAVLKVLGPLWGEGLVVEPFFVAGVMSGVCSPLDGARLLRARNQDVERFEYAILLSAWMAFLALHLGYVNIPFLDALRNHVFETVTGEISDEPLPLSVELEELLSLAKLTLPSGATPVLSGAVFGTRSERTAQKLSSRLNRVNTKLVIKGKVAPSVFGEHGFLKREVAHG